MADIEEFVVVETPPELKKETSRENSPVPYDDPPTTEPAEKSPEPVEKTPEPAPEKTPEPEEEKVEENEQKDPTPEPVKEATPPPAKEDTPPPTKEDTPPPVEEPKEEEGDKKEPTPEPEPKVDETPKEGDSEPPKEEEVEQKGEEPKTEEDTPTQEPEAAAPAPKQRSPIAISGKQIKQLLTGTELLKAKKGTKVFPRWYSISNDLVRLLWNSKRKPVAKSQIALSQIVDVIPGRKSASFQLYRGTQDEDRCFTVVYQENDTERTLDLISHTPEDAALWTNVLLAMTGSGVSESTAELRKKWLRKLFDDADVNGDGTLDLKEVTRMLKRLNIGISMKKTKLMFKEADKDGNGDNKLDFDEFCSMFADFSERPELRVLFNLYASSDDGSYMSAEDLLNFVHTEQDNTEATLDYCHSVIERFEPSDAGQNHLLSLDGFSQFILSDDNDIFRRDHTQVYQDMTQPLAHYFIASSHNTYLLEDQLSGPSSVDAYKNALAKGCRCVELDCWDGEDNEPIVYHGHTLTSKITFKDCIETIKEHSFKTSAYPVILSIENHCSVAQQHVMADHLEAILGDMLYKEERKEDLGKLPSPEELKNKILIKAKKLPKEHEDNENDDGEVSDEDEGAEVDKEEVQKAKVATSPPPTDNPDDIPDGPPSDPAPPQTEVRKVVRDRSGTVKKGEEDVQKPSAKRKLSSKLSKCVNYVQSVHFKGFEESADVPFYHMSSFGESSAFKHSESKASHFIEYNKTHLSRTYPAGVRVDSSNYEPVDLWNCGCQIVALNYQTSGSAMDYNLGKFQQNGGCGYILKPELMREGYSHFNHRDREPTTGITPKLVTIRVISGQRLPKPEGGDKDGEVIDPYVTVKFTGLSHDKNEFRTNYINDNGFNPVWNKTFTHVVKFPELALVKFTVKDYDLLTQDDFIGQYTLPVASLNTGYRTIKLRNTNWDVMEGATLLVEIRVQDWVGPTPKTKDRLRLLPLKKTREYPPMRPVSFPSVDAVFRRAKLTVHTAVDLREDYQFRLLLFKEACGKSTMADCIEALSSKAYSARVQLKLHMFFGKTYLIQDASAGIHEKAMQQSSAATKPVNPNVSGALSNIMVAFNQLNWAMWAVLNNDKVPAELDEQYEKAISHKDDFNNFISQPAQQKKAVQLKTNYSDNVRTLKNESHELKCVNDSIILVLEQIPKYAEKFGIPLDTPEPPVAESATPETVVEATVTTDTVKQDDTKEEVTAPADKEEEKKDNDEVTEPTPVTEEDSTKEEVKEGEGEEVKEGEEPKKESTLC